MVSDALTSVLDELFDAAYVVDPNRRITFWNKAAERLTGYRASEVVGHRCADDLLSHVDGEGRSMCRGVCPLVETLCTGKRHDGELFLHHKAGHRIAVRVRSVPLRDATGKVTAAVEIFRESGSVQALREEAERLRHLALLDSATDVGNRRFLESAIETAFSTEDRHPGLLFVDLDGFKAINDVHGHEVGDRVLRMVAHTIAGALRGGDVLGRWGGDEFLILLRDTEPKGLAAVGEKVRSLVASTFLEDRGQRLAVTVSIGGAVRRPGEESIQLISRADDLLYESKRRGRNAVTVEDEFAIAS